MMFCNVHIRNLDFPISLYNRSAYNCWLSTKTFLIYILSVISFPCYWINLENLISWIIMSILIIIKYILLFIDKIRLDYMQCINCYVNPHISIQYH